MIELTEPIRQESDLNFYNNILKPLRKGQFHEDMSNFKIQIELLKKESYNYYTDPRFDLLFCNFLFRHFSFVKNKHFFYSYFQCFQSNSYFILGFGPIEFIDLLSKNNCLVPYRKFIHQPLQFSLNQEQINEELLILQLGENYKFKKEFIQQNENYNKYYLMLPIGIRNYVAKQLGLQSDKFAQKTKQCNKSNAQQEITLFKNAEIVIRKNVDKKRYLINGQFAKITDMLFDIDFQSIKSMSKFTINKNEYIKENNLYGIIEAVNEQKKFTFSKQIIEEIKQFGQIRKINNVNFVMEKNISQEEKLNLYQKDIQPRLQQLQLLIENVGIQELKLYEKKSIQKVSINKQEFISEMQILVDQIEVTIQQLKYCKLKPKKQQEEILYRFLKINNLIKLYYIDIKNEKFGMTYLLRSVENLKLFMSEMPDFLIVYIHQILINLGYSRTIHTSQGSTFQNVIIDLEMTEQNQHGLLYTAMNRVKNIENLFFQVNLSMINLKLRLIMRQINFVKYLEDQYLNTLINGQIQQIWQNIIIKDGNLRKYLIDIKAKIQK